MACYNVTFSSSKCCILFIKIIYVVIWNCIVLIVLHTVHCILFCLYGDLHKILLFWLAINCFVLFTSQNVHFQHNKQIKNTHIYIFFFCMSSTKVTFLINLHYDVYSIHSNVLGKEKKKKLKTLEYKNFKLKLHNIKSILIFLCNFISNSLRYLYCMCTSIILSF